PLGGRARRRLPPLQPVTGAPITPAFPEPGLVSPSSPSGVPSRVPLAYVVPLPLRRAAHFSRSEQRRGTRFIPTFSSWPHRRQSRTGRRSAVEDRQDGATGGRGHHEAADLRLLSFSVRVMAR